MSQRRAIEFTAAQKALLDVYLAKLPEKIVEEGRRLLKQRKVRTWHWEVPETYLYVETEEHFRYVQSILFGRKGLDQASCTCHRRAGCKHLAAVALKALDGWKRAPDPVTGAPPVSSAPSPATPSTPGGSAEVGSASALTEYLTARTGQPLTRREAALVTAIETTWSAGKGSIGETELMELGGHTSYFYGWRPVPVPIWPAHRPPVNAIEAFHYIAHALRSRQKLPALRMYESVDWAAVDTLVKPWQRDQQVERWRKDLQVLGMRTGETRTPVVFRVRLSEKGADVEWKKPGSSEFAPIKGTALRECSVAMAHKEFNGVHLLDAAAQRFLTATQHDHQHSTHLGANTAALTHVLDRLLRQPGFEDAVVAPTGDPLVREPHPLRWAIETSPGELSATGHDDDYHLVLRTAEGTEVAPPLVTIAGQPRLYVLPDRVYELHDQMPVPAGQPPRISIPAGAIESEEGITALKALQVTLPAKLAARIKSVPVEVTVRCRMYTPPGETVEWFQVSAEAVFDGRRPGQFWNLRDWDGGTGPRSPRPAEAAGDAPILHPDRTFQYAAAGWLSKNAAETASRGTDDRLWLSRRLQGAALREFPETFLDWLAQRPEGLNVELDPALASLRDGRVSGTMKLDIEEAGIDWFDLRVSLDLSDVELTPAEIDTLLKAQGRWVRLPEKGWRRLELRISDEELERLADLGLAASDLNGGEQHRLHVFQLAGPSAMSLLPPERAADVRRRVGELRMSVTPDVPAALTATLRPYQRDGFHFLAYLSTNRFGGILADDMGLGKTVQALAWLAWLREAGHLDGPTLVVCPKSVQENWRNEVGRFCPGLNVRVWSGQTAGQFEAPPPQPPKARKKSARTAPVPEIIVINYAQLRLHEESLGKRLWSAVILDEAQYIKNPSSQTARAACALQADHRLALSGTPIENRLLDLWSIMQFAMPGVLGNRSGFTRNFNAKDDPLARRRLAARVRPFVMRRTKKEVASDLPDRIEEEIVCELEGPQEVLYRAELKRARAMLLKVKTSAQLDKLRFNILTSLLRLRQICCHPSLVGAGQPSDDAAKLTALLDLLEPLVEEGHKVLIFSQFVDMLEIIRTRLEANGWPHLMLTGKTENRGALLDAFQKLDGACLFLISLRAGGYGLNLTSASYVVLFDPWWNPAVENQAIDRTHRIGQTNKVIAYRLLARETIEEKIRLMQKRKGELATDILGEESFAKALSVDDFRFLLDGGPPT
ncbi:MAG: SNF2-related protein [Verrucomicrobiales bacterium]